MSPITLTRWVKGGPSPNRVFEAADPESKIIDFLEFVQALAVRNLRVHYHISLQKIRDAVQKASEEFNIDHPFARRHTTYLFERQLWIKPESQHSALVQISGREHGQEGMTPVIERFLVDVSFDPSTGLACSYKAFEKDGHKIVMDPKLRFGEPILVNCGYTPEALFEAAKSEGSADAAAKIYGVSKEQVDVCIDYFDHLKAA